MYMTTNYLDTVLIYTDCNLNIGSLCKASWRKYTPKKSASPQKLQHPYWHRSIENILLRYYPSLYGDNRLFLTFSLPKIYTSSDSNCYHIHGFDSHILHKKLYKILEKCLDISLLPSTILDWNLSRIDLFYMHHVPDKDKKYYLKTYKLLYLPRYVKSQYKNTIYLMSNLKKYRPASVVVRIYDKDLEMEQKSYKIHTLKYYPPSIADDIEKAIDIIDNGPLYGNIRIELQIRRAKLRRLLSSKSVTLKDLFNQSFQEDIMNDYIIKLGLNRKILNSTNFRKYIDNLNFRKDKRNNIIECAHQLRNGNSPFIKSTKYNGSKQTFNNYVNRLKADGIHILTNKDIDLKPIKLL